MSAYLAHSLSNLRTELNRRYPKRSKRLDGWIGDAAHAARPSDHNPDQSSRPPGVVRALDITAEGINVAATLRDVKAHPAVWYVIHRGTIWSRTHGFEPRRYLGSNPHNEHIHVSISHTTEAAASDRRWLTPLPPRRPVAPPYPGAKAFVVGSRNSAVTLLQRVLNQKATGVMSVDDLRAFRRWTRVRPRLWPVNNVVGPKSYASLVARAKARGLYR